MEIMRKLGFHGIYFIVALISSILFLAFENHVLFWLIFFVSIFVFVSYLKKKQREKRKKGLLEKYNDAELVKLIMSKSFWQNQTVEQLLDSLGKPHDVDQKILKSKKKEVWKYDHQGSNRYGLRITLDDDVVVGWDKKN